MATSRRRERELARRRFERRRQAELERRARAKQRNRIIGSVSGVVAVIAVVLVLVFTVFTGGSGKSHLSVKPGASGSPTVSASATPPAPKHCKAIKPNPPAKGQPQIPDVKGKAPTQLVTKDITVGHGPAAKDGDAVKVTYIGVGCSTGKVFDASYLHPPVKPLPVSPLGQAQVIPGFNQGLVGIKQGGVRELVIPAALGYGSQGSQGIAPNETLIFLVTATSVKPGA